MTSRARRGDDYAPALFPFLAVLLCTIGALVLILVINVVQSHASARRETEAEIEHAVDVSETMQTVSDELEARREKLKSEVEKRRRELAYIEDHISRLQKDMEKLISKAEAIESQSATTEADKEQREERIAQIRDEIEKKKQEIAKEIDAQKKKKPAFAIIPYSGSNGTSRRPVYLECCAEGVILQPEGLLIKIEDLRPPHGPGNPLDAALRVLRNAYQQKDATFGITTPPYPLLVVRPDGINTYALARSAMGGWDDQFGYELIDSDMKMVYPPGLPGIADELKTALDLARRRQAAMIAHIPRGSSPSSMSLEEDWGSEEGIGIETQGNSWGDEQVGAPGQESGIHVSESSNWKMVQQLNPGQVVGGGTSRNGSQSSGAGGNGNPNSGLSFPSGANVPPPNSFSAGSGTNLSGQYVAGQNGSLVPLTSEQWNASSAGNGGDGRSADAGQSSNGVAGTAGSTTSQDARMGGSGADQSSVAGSANGSASAGAGNGSGSANGDGSANASGSAGSNGQGGSGASTASGSMSSSNTLSNGASPDGSRANAFSSGTASGSAGAGSLSSMGSASSPQTTPDGQPQIPNISIGMQSSEKETPAKQAARKRRQQQGEREVKPISVSAGRDWATNRTEGKATPVSRPIRIIALADQWMIRSDKNERKHDAVIELEQGPQQASKELEKAVRERVDSWGLSLPGGYWCPTITIEAASDASLSVQRLQRMLEGSGVEIKVVPLQAPSKR